MKSLVDFIKESKAEKTTDEILRKEVSLSKFPVDYEYCGDSTKDIDGIRLSINHNTLENIFKEINGALYEYNLYPRTELKTSDACFTFNARNVKGLLQNSNNREELENNGLIELVKQWSENGILVDLYYLTPRGEAYIKDFFKK